MSNVSLIIPAYNEAERIGEFLQSIIDWNGEVLEIIVVDDGSQDDTAKVVEGFRDRLPMLQVLVHPKNKGKGGAVQTGVMAARGDYAVFMDADGATPIDELPKMVSALNEKQIGVGNRWMAGANAELHSPLRKLSSLMYRTYMSLFGLGDVDTMCGFKGYHREVARELFTDLLEQRWLFDTEIAYKAVRRGYTVRNFPITWVSKDGSKLDTATLIKSALSIWPLINRIKRLEKRKKVRSEQHEAATQPQLFQVGAKAIFVSDNKALILRAENHLPHWDLPGGRLEAGESIEPGLHRELAEELPNVTNVVIQECVHAQTMQRLIDKKPMVGLYYRATGDTANLTLSPEHVSHRWITKEELPLLAQEAKLFEADRTALEKALE